MSPGARRVRAALLIVITTALLGAPAFATGLVMRLDGAGASIVSTMMLVVVTVHGILGLWLLWSVWRASARPVRARYRWWVGSAAAIVACFALAMSIGFEPSLSAMLDLALGLLGAILTRREIRSIDTFAPSPPSIASS